MIAKRDVAIIDVVAAYPSGANIDTGTSQRVIDLIADGYEIASAVPLTTSSYCGVQYVLVKENKQ